jgi:hypothetical protein
MCISLDLQSNIFYLHMQHMAYSCSTIRILNDFTKRMERYLKWTPHCQLAELYTGVPPHLWVIHSKTYCSYVKPMIIPNAIYSGISIYRSRNVRFLVFIVRHLWSRIKFHVNNVTYFCIHRSPTYRFSAFITCKSRSRHSISHMDFLAGFIWEKKLKRAIYVGSVLRTQRHVWQTVCMYSLPLFICVISTLPMWPSVSRHPYLRFKYDYGSTKETCENFARPIENNTWSWEENPGETCGHCKTDVDRENILSLENSYFQLRQNSAKKQKMGTA